MRDLKFHRCLPDALQSSEVVAVVELCQGLPDVGNENNAPFDPANGAADRWLPRTSAVAPCTHQTQKLAAGTEKENFY